MSCVYNLAKNLVTGNEFFSGQIVTLLLTVQLKTCILLKWPLAA